MALLTRAELCEQLGWVSLNHRGKMAPETNKLSVHIQRGKVILDATGLVETTHPTNKAFILRATSVKPKKTNNKTTEPKASQVPKTEKPPAPKPPKAETSKPPKAETSKVPKPEETEEPQLDEDGLMPLEKSDKHYNHWRAIKTENAATLDMVKIEKEKGTLILTDLVIPLFQSYNQQILVAMSNMTEDALRVLCKKYDVSVEDRAHIKGTWREIINKTLENAKAGTKKQLKALIAQ